MEPITRTETGFGPGAEATSAPRVPGIPTFVTHGSGSISIAFTSNGNDAVVTYAIRVKVDPELDGTYTTAGYVQADGTVGVGEIFQTLAQWTTTIAVSGLTVYYAYTFAVKAKNEAAVESAYSAESRIMCTLPTLDDGMDSDSVAREVTSGNIKVGAITLSGTLASEATNSESWYGGSVGLTFALSSYVDSTAAEVEGRFSEDGGSTWATATLTGTLINLPATTGGTTNSTVYWDSYTDAGTSESQTDVMVQLRAKDSDGDWGGYTNTAQFIIYNRPAKPEVINYDSRAWDKDTTPVFTSVIPHPRGGSVMFPKITIFQTTEGTPAVTGYPKKSVEDVTGWFYEATTPGDFIQMLVSGIPASAYNGVRRWRYTVQTPLAAGSYTVTFGTSEPQDLS